MADAENGKCEKTKVVYGDVNRELVKELERSAVGESLHPIEIQTFEARLRGDFLSIEKVRKWSAYKSLITFS